MKYWIVVASRDHLDAAVRGGFIQAGHGRRSAIARLSPGDRLVGYAPRLTFGEDEPYQRFAALGTVESGEIYLGGDLMDKSGEAPARRRVGYAADVRDAPVRVLLPRLSFVHDERHWGYPFRRGLFEIPVADFEVIAAAMRP